MKHYFIKKKISEFTDDTANVLQLIVTTNTEQMINKKTSKFHQKILN
jgi:hypothetical protein